ncbi:hypothetical protein PQX77_014415 [Marasmius sp. AFHP31]|nr:hypothetical protein PQX77_014415 [Marasmius sp. AFHP31]
MSGPAKVSKVQRLSTQDISEPFIQAQTSSNPNFSSEPDGRSGKASDGWQHHPSELDYLTPTDLTETQPIYCLITNSFDVPPKLTISSFCEITGVDGSKTRLPCGYRVPLMFVARSQWLALRLVLGASNRVMEWERRKYGILNVSRLCTQFLLAARELMGGLGDVELGKSEKSETQMAYSRPRRCQEVRPYFGEIEYAKDPLRSDWRRLAVKGHQGFVLTEDEIDNGIFAHQMMSGLEKDTAWTWKTTGIPAPEGSEGIDAWSLRVTALESSRNTLRLLSFANDESLSEVSDQASKRPGSPLEKAGMTKLGRLASGSTNNASQARLDTHDFPSCPTATNHNNGLSASEIQDNRLLAWASANGRSSMETATTIPESMKSTNSIGQLPNVYNPTHLSQLDSAIPIGAPPLFASKPGNGSMRYPSSQLDSHMQEVNPYLLKHVVANANSGQAASMEEPIGRSLFPMESRSRPEEDFTSEVQPHSHPRCNIPTPIERSVRIPRAQFQPTSNPLPDSQPNSQAAATTAEPEDNTHTANPQAIASLIGNFVETLPRHTQELRTAMEDELRDIRTGLRGIVRGELLRSLEEAPKNTTRATVVNDIQVQEIVERPIRVFGRMSRQWWKQYLHPSTLSCRGLDRTFGGLMSLAVFTFRISPDLLRLEVGRTDGPLQTADMP